MAILRDRKPGHSPLQVNVVPREREKFALPRGCLDSKDDHRLQLLDPRSVATLQQQFFLARFQTPVSRCRSLRALYLYVRDRDAPIDPCPVQRGPKYVELAQHRSG